MFYQTELGISQEILFLSASLSQTTDTALLFPIYDRPAMVRSSGRHRERYWFSRYISAKTSAQRATVVTESQAISDRTTAIRSVLEVFP